MITDTTPGILSSAELSCAIEDTKKYFYDAGHGTQIEKMFLDHIEKLLDIQAKRAAGISPELYENIKSGIEKSSVADDEKKPIGGGIAECGKCFELVPPSKIVDGKGICLLCYQKEKAGK